MAKVRKWKQLELFGRWEGGNRFRESPVNKHGANYWFAASGKPNFHALAVYNRKFKFHDRVTDLAKEYDVGTQTIYWVLRKVKEYGPPF